MNSCINRGWGKNTTGLSVTFRITEKIRKRKCYSRKKINSGPALASMSAGELLRKNKKKEMLFMEKKLIVGQRC